MERLDDIECSYGLSPMQQGMLFHSVSRPRPGADLQQLTCVSPEALDVPAFLAAWERVVARHAILRTSFRWRDLPAPRQDVHRRASLPVTRIDLRGRAPAEQRARQRAFLAADRARGFVLTEAPCARLALLRVDDSRTDFIWSFHHLLLDGRSFLTVLREVFAHYEALRAGRELQLPEPRRFGDYIAWLEARAPDASAGFWRALLAGREGPTPLPMPRVEPRVLDVGETSGRLCARLGGAESAALRAQAEAHGLTVNTLVQGAWAVLLARHAGVPEVIFGATRAGRHGTIEGADTIVGMTINTVPVRARVPPDAPLLPALRALREQWVAMRPHEHAPLARIREWAGARGDAPLFETLLVAESYDWLEVLKAEDGPMRRRAFEMIEWTHFPLTLAADLGPAIVLGLEFDRGRIADDDAERLLGRLERVLAGMSGGLALPVGALPLASAAERRRALVEWNATARDHREERCVHELFEARADATPDAAAVVFEQRGLTYRELDVRADQLAHALRARGVGPEALVAVFMNRSLELLVALCGVLKAGGAYLPLDPDHPQDRLAFMLDEARPLVILTQSRLATRLPSSAATVVHVDADAPADPTRRPDRGALSLDHLAYVLYTSGSTGRPKGAMNAHRGIQNRLVWMQRAFELGAADRVLQKTPISFDVSVWELLWPLVSGATLILARPGGHRDPAYLAELIATQGVTTTHFVPSMLGAFLDEPRAAACRSLRRVFASGEALSPALCERFFRVLPGVELHNLYGPTEAAIDVTHWVCRPGAAVVPIGRPIDNVRTYVLDERRQPVPEGVPGELYLAGVQVGRGYLNRPDLTAACFGRDPFVERGALEGDHARMYRTGDLARWRASGDLEHLGRADLQVKIRGCRVEPGEVEAALTRHPRVGAAVVVAREEGDGGKRLVAYVETAGACPPTAEELRAHLRGVLLEPMVPADFVVLDRLPLGLSGKVDRAALPAPARGGASRSRVPPRTSLEELLAEIWADELGVSDVGVHDNYFDLGGHSLASLRIMDRTAHAGLQLTSAQVFQHQTIAELAAVIAATPAPLPREGRETWPLVVMRDAGERPPLFLVHTTPGDLLGYTGLVRALGSDQPCYGFQSLALQRPTSAHRTIEEMAACYVDLMKATAPRGPYHLAGWCYGGLVAFEMARRLVASGDGVGLLALVDAMAPGPGLAVPDYYVDCARAARRMGPRALARYLGEKARAAASVLAREPATPAPGNRAVAQEQNLRALARWRPRPYPGLLTVLRSSGTTLGVLDDPALRWTRLAAALETRVIRASRSAILREPCVRALAAELRAAMDRAPRPPSPDTISGGATAPERGSPL
jgi:amino acid adenylation domain-containing protein